MQCPFLSERLAVLIPFDQHAQPLHVYPLRLYDFADGFHVVRVLGEEGLVGKRLTAATVYHDYGPADPVRPDVLLEPTAADFVGGRDPVLERALALP
jgi:hypothetical protein